MEITKKISNKNFVVYEFTLDDINYFVRFFRKDGNLWRVGYWFDEKSYYENNINKIKDRLPNETDQNIISRLNYELDYFQSKIQKAKKENFFNKTSPLKVTNTVSECVRLFLSEYYDEVDVLEIQHMKEGTEEISTRAKMGERILPKYIDSNLWNYMLLKSTSYVFKKGIDLSNYNLEIY